MQQIEGHFFFCLYECPTPERVLFLLKKTLSCRRASDASLGLFCFRADGLGAIMHFMDGIDGYERIGIYLFQIGHQSAKFLLIHNGDDLTEGIAGICADGLHQRSPALQSIEDIVQNFGLFLGNDADTFFFGLMPKMK